MAAKGATAKQAIFEKMLKVFEGSFIYNSGKELRIPWEEENGPLEIKVTLTAAKDMVGAAEAETVPIKTISSVSSDFPAPKENIEPSQEEKDNVANLLNALGLN